VASFADEFSFNNASGDAQFRGLKVEGIEDIQRIFRDLPVRMANKIKKELMTKTLKPMESEIKQLLPVKTGNLVNSVKTRVSNKKTGILYGQVTTTGKTGAHGHLIERGWWLTTHKTNLGIATVSRRIKWIEGRHIFRRVLEKNANRIVDEFTQGLSQAAEQAEKEANGGT